MKEILIKITYDDENCYRGHGEVKEALINSVKNAIEIDLAHDGVIKPNWNLEILEEDARKC